MRHISDGTCLSGMFYGDVIYVTSVSAEQILCTTRPSTGSDRWPTPRARISRTWRSGWISRAFSRGTITWSRSLHTTRKRVQQTGLGAASSVRNLLPGLSCRSTGWGSASAHRVDGDDPGEPTTPQCPTEHREYGVVVDDPVNHEDRGPGGLDVTDEQPAPDRVEAVQRVPARLDRQPLAQQAEWVGREVGGDPGAFECDAADDSRREHGSGGRTRSRPGPT